MFDFFIVGAGWKPRDYLKDAGGPWKFIYVGDGFAQAGDGVTEWRLIG